MKAGEQRVVCLFPPRLRAEVAGIAFLFPPRLRGEGQVGAATNASASRSPPQPSPQAGEGADRRRGALAITARSELLRIRFEFQAAKTTVMASAIEAIHRGAIRSYLAKAGYPAGRGLSVRSRTPVGYWIPAFAGDDNFGFDIQTAPFVRHRLSISPRIAVVGFGRCWQTGIGRHGGGACACHATRIPIRRS